MRVQLTPTSAKALTNAPLQVRKAFLKQITFLQRDLKHPSLHAKKYDEAKDVWQGRVNRDWRFYFTIRGDTYFIQDVIPHPK